MSAPGFEGRIVVITGAGKGLGRSYARYLAARGARVVVNNRRRGDEESSADRVVAEIRAEGGVAAPNYADVSDPRSGEEMMAQAMQEFGRLDALIASAGIGHGATLHKLNLETFRHVLEVNFFGTLSAVHAAYRVMRSNGYGRIVVSTSSAGLYGNLGMSAYSASKAALIGLVRSLALEGKPKGVLVNAIAPFAVTQMTEAIMPEAAVGLFPPEAVAPVVAALVSEGCPCTGEVLVAGAGWVRRAETRESVGAAFDPVQPDTLATRWDEVQDMEGARAFEYADQAFLDLVRQVTELTEATR